MASTADTDLAKILVYGGSTRSGTLSATDIGTILDSEPSVYYGAAMIAESEAGNLAGEGGKQVGDLKIEAGAATEMRKIAISLRRRAVARAKPFAGAMSVAEKQTEDGNTDRPDPVFWWGQFTEGSASSS